MHSRHLSNFRAASPLAAVFFFLPRESPCLRNHGATYGNGMLRRQRPVDPAEMTGCQNKCKVLIKSILIQEILVWPCLTHPSSEYTSISLGFVASVASAIWPSNLLTPLLCNPSIYTSLPCEWFDALQFIYLFGGVSIVVIWGTTILKKQPPKQSYMISTNMTMSPCSLNIWLYADESGFWPYRYALLLSPSTDSKQGLSIEIKCVMEGKIGVLPKIFKNSRCMIPGWYSILTSCL